MTPGSLWWHPACWLTCLCTVLLQGWAVMDFSLIEKKVLIASGVTVTFQNLVLLNVRCVLTVSGYEESFCVCGMLVQKASCN